MKTTQRHVQLVEADEWEWSNIMIYDKAERPPHEYDKGGEPQDSTVVDTVNNPDLAEWREEHNFGRYNSNMRKNNARQTL